MTPRRGRTGTVPGPPAGTRAFWDRATVRWERFEPHFLATLAAVDPALFRALRLASGRRVLDVGCGSGEPSLAIAQLVAPRGRVLGIDLSPAMLAIARRRARQRGVANVRFRAADIGRARLPAGRYDGVVSRFGLMFVADVPRALATMRAALRPGGRAAFAVWGPMARNPVAALSARASRPFLDAPPPPPERGPHPMRFGRRDALPGMMRAAGFRDLTAVGVRVPHVYGGEDEFLAIQLGCPNPLRDLYRSLSLRDQGRMRGRLVRGLRRYRSGPVLRVPGFAWVVAGRR